MKIDVSPFASPKANRRIARQAADPGRAALRLERGLRREPRQARREARQAAGASVPLRPLRAADRAAGHGHRRQGRRDRPCHVGRQSAGLQGRRLQDADADRGGARLPLARMRANCPSAGSSACSTAPITSRCWSRASTPNFCATEGVARRRRRSRALWAERLHSIRALRAPSPRQRHALRQDLPHIFEGRAAPAPAAAPRRSRQDLEGLARRRRRAQLLAGLSCAPTSMR